jgi:hypothetical protein
MTDAAGVLEMPYRIDGERLTLGAVEYRRAGIAAAR